MTELTGQKKYPVIQFEDGSWYREESKDMERDDPWPVSCDREAANRRSYTEPPRGYSSVGRAPGSHPGGRRFEPG